jgi:hypothetical protein
MQIEMNLDQFAAPGERVEWPYMDECIARLRTFYAEMT